MPIARDGHSLPHRHISTGTSADAVNLTQKPATLWSADAFNLSSNAIFWLHLYDSTAAPGAGSSAVLTYPIPYSVLVEGSTREELVAGFTKGFPHGCDFQRGLSYRLSTTSASTATSTGVSAGLVILDVVFTPTS